MATRTQKAARKTKADAGKATTKPKADAKATKGVKPKAKAKPAKTTKASIAKPGPTDDKMTLGERFWHRIGLGAKAKEERAHKVHLEHEERLREKIEQDKLDRERAEQEALAARKAHEAADRKAAQKSAREMARIAREEDKRLKREAIEAEARAIAQAEQDRKDAAAARREQARTAKLQAAAEAQLAEQEKAAAAARAAEEKAAHRRASAEARREAARLAREQAKADAEREAEERASAEATAAEERAAKRREAAEARREKARQEKIAAEAKAEERRLARQRKLEEKAREEELARLEEEAQARRAAPKMDVDLRVKGEAPAEDVEGEAVEADKKNGAAKALPADALETQADRVAEELRSRRSKPITIDSDDVPTPRLPVGRKGRDEEPKQVLELDPAPPARMEVAAPRGLSIPEHFLLLALEEVWDERREKATPGNLGGALAGSLLLELVLQDKVRVQRDRFQVTEAAVDDPAAAVVAKLKEVQDRPSLQVMGALAKALPELLPAYKDRLAARGLIEHRAWRHMGMFYRSQTALVDGDAQERLRNKLARAIAGGGRPDAPTILSLGLLEACGLFGVVVPEGAQAYNRKRLNGLLAGKDVMGYKVDDELRGIQEMAVRTILDNVRLMTVRG